MLQIATATTTLLSNTFPKPQLTPLGKLRVELEERVEKGEITTGQMKHALVVYFKETITPEGSLQEINKASIQRVYRTAGFAIARNAKTFDNNPKEFRYPYLEQFTMHVLGTCSENVQLDSQFAKMVIAKCLSRITKVLPLYREIYKLNGLPSKNWIKKVLVS